MLLNFGYGAFHVYCELLLGHVFLFESVEVGSVHNILISSILLIILWKLFYVPFVFNAELWVDLFKFLFTGATPAILLAEWLMLETNFGEGIHRTHSWIESTTHVSIVASLYQSCRNWISSGILEIVNDVSLLLVQWLLLTAPHIDLTFSTVADDLFVDLVLEVDPISLVVFGTFSLSRIV